MTKLMIAVMTMAGLSLGSMRASPARMEKMVDARVEVFLDDVGARPDQRERVKQLEAELKTDLQPLAKQAKASREQLAEQWKAPVVDRVQVHAIVDRQIQGATAFLHRAADALISLHDLLTPEQREKAAELRAARD